MRRASSFRTTVTTLLLVLLLAACGEDEPSRAGGDGGGASSGPGANDGPDGGGPAPKPMTEEPPLDVEWWGRKPTARLFLSGGQQGAFRPTSHDHPPTGGLERTAAVLYRVRDIGKKQGTAVGAVGLGWSMRGNLEQQEEARADYLRALHAALGYDAALLGGTDLTVDAMCQPRGPGPETPTPPLNVKPSNTNPTAGATRVYADVQVGPVAVRALGIVDPVEAQVLADAGLVDAVSSPAQNMAGLRPKPDAVWVVGTRLIGKGTLGEIVGSLRRLGPGIVVDMSGKGFGEAKLDRAPLRADGDPLVVALPPHGTDVGVLDFDKGDDGAWLVSYRQIPLVAAWEKYGGPALASAKHLSSLYRQLLRERRYVHTFQRMRRTDATYVGSSACAACHAAIYNDWRGSTHATALEGLTRVGHEWDPECLRCHVVGWERGKDGTWTSWKSGFRDAEKTPFMGGVGCENCHGPGSAHAADPYDRSLFAPGGPNRRSMDKQGCMTCHDAENHHGFAEAFETQHLPAVDHRRVPSDRRTVLPEGWKKGGSGR